MKSNKPTSRLNKMTFLYTETLQDKAVSCGAIDVLNTYLQKCSDDESTLNMALLSLNCLVDSGRCHHRFKINEYITAGINFPEQI